jgi:sugar lactone lactonase YvrE
MGEVSLGPDLLGSRELVRLNDGSVDPHGAFVVGTASLDPSSLTAPAGNETLLRVWADGRVETLRTGIRLSNGIAFSPKGDIIYHVDTYSDTVSSHSYGAEFDHQEPWQTVLTDLPGHPDGLTVDEDGALWVALWGASRVQRHSPTGETLATVNVDAGQVSCPGLVGPDLATLAITTGQEGLEVVDDQTGAIFIAEVGVRGIPAHRWRGSTTIPYWLNQAPRQEHA